MSIDESKPLSGIRVLDMGRVVAGPLASFFLAALGAEVIRVETPGGDLTWQVPPFISPSGGRSNVRDSEDISIGHLRRGRGKRSVVLDLDESTAYKKFLELLSTADVVIENLRPGALEAKKSGYETARHQNARIIWCSISGYGQTGPFSKRPAIDICIQAESGLLDRTGWPNQEGVRAGATVADHLGAMNAVIGVLAALRQRELTGEGTWIDVSMLDAVASMMWDEPLDLEASGTISRQGNSDRRGAPHGVYPTTDGSVAVVVTSNAQWKELVGLMANPGLYEKYSTPASRAAASSEIDALVADWTGQFLSEDIAETLGDAGIPVGVVRKATELRAHPQLIHRGLFEELQSGVTKTGSGLFGAQLPFLMNGLSMSASPAEPLGWSTDKLVTDKGDLK